MTPAGDEENAVVLEAFNDAPGNVQPAFRGYLRGSQRCLEAQSWRCSSAIRCSFAFADREFAGLDVSQRTGQGSKDEKIMQEERRGA